MGAPCAAAVASTQGCCARRQGICRAPEFVLGRQQAKQDQLASHIPGSSIPTLHTCHLQAYWLTCSLAAGGLLKARTFGLPYGSKLFRLGELAAGGAPPRAQRREQSQPRGACDVCMNAGRTRPHAMPTPASTQPQCQSHPTPHPCRQLAGQLHGRARGPGGQRRRHAARQRGGEHPGGGRGAGGQRRRHTARQRGGERGAGTAGTKARTCGLLMFEGGAWAGAAVNSGLQAAEALRAAGLNNPTQRQRVWR